MLTFFFKDFGVALTLGLLLITTGCGGSGAGRGDLAQVYPVRGTVTHGGRGVEGATVSFQPQNTTQPAAYGKTDAQGRFRLTTYDADDGAVEGEFTVTVMKFEIVAPDIDGDADDPGPVSAPPPVSHIPERYSNPNTSGLSATVTAGSSNEITLELTD